MPRRREHDPEHVRQGLMAAFRKGGFAGTSFSDLEAATGLDRAQLSREYGDKRRLFLDTVEQFMDLAFAEYLRPLSDSGGLRAISRMLLMVPELTESEQARLGCMVCNTCREPIALTDPDVAALVTKHFRRMEAAFASALRNAVAAGEIEMSAATIRRTARHLYGVHVSLLVLLRAGESKAVLKDIATQALGTLR